MAIGFLVVSAVGLTSSCGGSTGDGGGSGTPGDDCEGGVVINGVCEGKCTPDKCIADNTCVGNRCMLKCDAHTDCYPDGSQNCAPAKEDGTGADLFVCQRNDVPRGMGIKCPFKFECDGLGICPNGQGCERSQCGNQPDACMKDEAACGNDANCTIGKCPDGTGCVVNPCTAAECMPLSCLSKGEGDADAYCTRQDCQSDADCAGGFYCGITRDPHELCGSDPQKGDNTFCGTTSEACIEPTALGQGNTMFEGSRCILRKTCIKRAQCAPCETDLDCSQLPTQKCVAQMDGTKSCARSCTSKLDCDPDYDCMEGSCKPRFGGCKGTGGFCHPCQNDEDCGGKDTAKACIEASGNQRACFDYALFATDCVAPDCVVCMTDADCPISPSGRRGECFDEGEGYGPADTVYHRCYLPYDAPDNKFGCW